MKNHHFIFFFLGFFTCILIFGGKFAFATVAEDIKRRLDEVNYETNKQLYQTSLEHQAVLRQSKIDNVIAIQKAVIKANVKARFKDLKNILTTKELEVKMRTKRLETDLKIKKSRDSFYQDIKNKNANTQSILIKKNQDTLAFVKERQEAFDMDASFRKEDMEKRLETFHRDLQNNLSKIKDENKKTTVEELATDFQSVNRKAMDKFAEDLKNLDALLGQLESHLDEAVANGASAADPNQIFHDASNAITDARQAVAVQYGKIHTIAIKDEDSIKSLMANTRKILDTDINTVKAKVDTARAKVKEFADIVAGISVPPDTDVDTLKVDDSASGAN